MAFPHFRCAVPVVLILDVFCQVLVPSEFVLTEVTFVLGGSLMDLAHVPQQGGVVLALEVEGAIGVPTLVPEIGVFVPPVCDQTLVGAEVQIAFFATEKFQTVDI